MRKDDIEKILQQYGVDRRQQQQAADSLHGLARHQRRRAIMVCSAILLATTVWSVYQFALPKQGGSVVIAQEDSPKLPQPNIQETTPPNAYPISHTYKKRPVSISSTTPPLPEQTPEEHYAANEITKPAAIATTLKSYDTDTLETNTLKPEVPIQPTLQPFEYETLLLADNPESQPSNIVGKRFHLSASIGASAIPQMGSGASGGIEMTGLNGLNASQKTYSRMSPSATLAANVGFNYSIPLGERQGLELGIGLSGYSHQTEITTYQAGTTGQGVDGNEIVTLQPIGHPETSSTFSLYASLPLTFNFKPNGTNMGWNMSITPSHSLFTPRSTGVSTVHTTTLNPWRLTMGLGITLQHGFLRRISLTANLLPIYTSSSLHEVGVEIGF